MSSPFFAFPSSQNQAPVQWQFNQENTASMPNPSSATGPSRFVPVNVIRTNRKRSPSQDSDDSMDCQQEYNGSSPAPTKRRKGLTDATATTVNSPTIFTAWPKRS